MVDGSVKAGLKVEIAGTPESVDYSIPILLAIVYVNFLSSFFCDFHPLFYFQFVQDFQHFLISCQTLPILLYVVILSVVMFIEDVFVNGLSESLI